MTFDDPIWDYAFHGAAWQAFAEGVAETGGVPDSRTTKRRAYQLYEQGLAEKSAGTAPAREVNRLTGWQCPFSRSSIQRFLLPALNHRLTAG